MMQLDEIAYLTTLYSAKPRSYHSMSHINDLLLKLEKNWPAIMEYLRKGAAYNLHEQFCRSVLTRAIWWHDAVYVPGSATNEQESAALFDQWVQRNLAEPKVLTYPREAELVRELILKTASYMQDLTFNEFSSKEGGLGNHLVQVMLDLDLSGLGAYFGTYCSNSIGIWHEFGHFGNQAFVEGRTKFLQKMLERKRIFYTPVFADLEETAQMNMKLDLRLIEEYGSNRNGQKYQAYIDELHENCKPE